MNRILVLALPLVLCSVAFAQPDPNAPGLGVNPPEVRQHFNVSTPEGAVRDFVQDLKSGFEPGLQFDVVGARPGFYGTDDWPRIFEDLGQLRGLRALKVDTVKGTPEGDEVTVSITAHLEDKQTGHQGNPETFTLKLHRGASEADKSIWPPDANGWRVVPPPIEEVLAKPLYETPPLQLAAALATRDPRLLPAIRQYQGLNQLKQLGLGAMQFTLDYDEFYAFDDAAHERALRPYLKDDSLYTIAGTKDQKWHFNDLLSTLSLAKLNEPARTVLFYDGEAPTSDKLNFRFGDKTMIGFADGHCKALSKDELKDLIWKP
jgi:prepilin-type processing-associated H-X9-DG protein